MVLFIKPITSVVDDMDVVCKMMINIEQNKNIFNINGTINTNVKPFNNFIHQGINYEMTVSMGVLLLYIPPNINIIYRDIEQRLNHNFRENIIFDDNETKVPINTYSYNSTYYTLLTTKYTNEMNNTAYRRIINNFYDVKKACESGSKFVWLIQIIDKPYLQIPELSIKIPNKIHLMRSISTIIYDGTQLFNVTNGLHQLDYPSLSQYDMFKNNQILNETIHISQISGLDYEIAHCYDNNISKKPLFTSGSNEVKLVNLSRFSIRRPNPKKKWYQQLSEPFDFNEQEELEKNIKETGKPSFRNDVCFITGMPLYKKAYLLKVSYKNIPNNSNKEKYSSYILVSLYAYHTITCNRYLIIDDYLRQKNIILIKTYTTNFNRSESDVIDMIPKKNISPLKREIMKSISFNGAYRENDNNNSDYIYTADVQKNKIYIGIINNVNDFDIMKYNNTNTILFHTIFLD